MSAVDVPLISDGYVSASGSTIRLLHCPTCDAERVCDLAMYEVATGRKTGVCLTCDGLVPSDEFEESAGV